MPETPFIADNTPGAEPTQPQWQTAVPGFQLTPAEIAVSASYQAEKHAACGIDTSVFQGDVDPSFFIGIGIHGGIRSGISAQGNVNMLQQLIQYRPIALGERLQFCGHIEAVTEVPRGHTVQTSVVFEDTNGNIVLDASRTSLRPDPAKATARGAGQRPAPVVEDPTATNPIAAHQLTPEQVKHYSTEGNSIHYDEAAAKAAGFRAPMIGGGMGVHFLAAAIWADGTPQHLDLDIYFRRPIFWDETFTTAVLGNRQHRERWQALCLLRDEQEQGLKVLTEARIRRLTR